MHVSRSMDLWKVYCFVLYFGSIEWSSPVRLYADESSSFSSVYECLHSGAVLGETTLHPASIYSSFYPCGVMHAMSTLLCVPFLLWDSVCLAETRVCLPPSLQPR